VSAVENACQQLSAEATGTLVHGRLDPVGATGSWQLTWTNAGHPPPLLGRRGADTELLAAAPAGLPLPDLLSQLIGATAATSADDMVLLAVRIPPA
jgi:hypothetical protein